MNFTISALHLLPQCSPSLTKGLKDEWYLFNDTVYLEKGQLHIRKDKFWKDSFFGKNISISAIVGMNGCGKSSVLEMMYRIINNTSAILERGKRRRAAETLYFIENLWAELYYIIDEQLCMIGCYGNNLDIILPNGARVPLSAFSDEEGRTTEVLMKDLVSYSFNGLFYTIVTNYSLQAFISQDYQDEAVYILGQKRGPHPKESASWINGVFHKNDGYMTPIVLNPYRDNGIMDMENEHHLSLYRLSSCFIHARNTRRPFIEDYELHSISYEYDRTYVQNKIISEYTISEEYLWNYKPNMESHPSYADSILSFYGITSENIDWSEDTHRMPALYLVYKTLAIANRYPGYDEFASLTETVNINQSTNPESKAYLEKLVDTIMSDKSHVTLKIRQVLHYLEACKNGMFTTKMPFENFPYDDYVAIIGGDPTSKYMSEIQEFLPPSFFKINLMLDHYYNGKRDNNEPIPINRLSSGERQYLYTFSTYIYHIQNLLSIHSSNRVRYRRFNLVFDEVEICFHPEYQRRFINELLGFIDRLRLNSYAAFNIIIATHSPFILSDIPKGNILYLENGMNANDAASFKNPLSANICDILYQSFFLKNGFVGEYSRNKVYQIIKYLYNIDRKIPVTTLADINNMIEQIGDPFIVKHLKELLNKHI